MRYALFVLGRATFDTGYAEARVSEALAALGRAGVETVGSRGILFDNAAVAAAIAAVSEPVAGAIVIQATFTDAEAIVAIAGRFGPPRIWALPEPRTGGRLRLNAFCGLNLAAHALGLRGVAPAWLFADPLDMTVDARVAELIAAGPAAPPSLREARPEPGAGAAAERGLAALHGARVGRFGEHPAGFDTCAYSDDRVASLGASVDRLELAALFARARAVDADVVAKTRQELAAAVAGLDRLDANELDRSLRLEAALEAFRSEGGYAAFALRCWPEAFTEYGGALCGPAALLGEARTPCGCEADVMGVLTSLLLQGIAGAPAFLADVVDMDDASDTAVLWHCGQAPPSLADPAAVKSATVHSNRRMPLLFEFPLKPGSVTLARLSQARGAMSLVLGRGEVVAAPPSFSGTSGVVRFDRPVAEVRDRMLGGGVEHHLGLVYGRHEAALEHVAAALGLPVLDLTQ